MTSGRVIPFQGTVRQDVLFVKQVAAIELQKVGRYQALGQLAGRLR